MKLRLTFFILILAPFLVKSEIVEFDWAQQMDIHEFDMVGYCIDQNGHRYIAATMSQPVNVAMDQGSHILTSNGETDFFVAKYDTTGALIWAHKFGGIYEDKLLDMVIDESSNRLFLTGWYEHVVDFDPGIGESNMYGYAITDITLTDTIWGGAFTLWLDLDGNFESVERRYFDGQSFQFVDGELFSFDREYIRRLDQSSFSTLNSTALIPYYGSVIKEITPDKSFLFHGEYSDSHQPALSPSSAGLLNLAPRSGASRYSTLVKVGPDGLLDFGKNVIACSGDIEAGGTISDRDGNIYVFTTVEGEFAINPNQSNEIIVTPSPQSIKLVIQKLNSNGDYIWHKIFDTDRLDPAGVKTIDFHNNLYFVYDSSKPKLKKLNPNGDEKWEHRISKVGILQVDKTEKIHFGTAGWPWNHDIDPSAETWVTHAKRPLMAQWSQILCPPINKNITGTLCGGFISVNGNKYDENHPVGTELVYGSGADCDTIVNINLSFIPSPIEVSIDSLSEYNCSNSGFASASVIGSTGAVSYSWDADPNETGNTLTIDSTGRFTVLVTDSTGCSDYVDFLLDGTHKKSDYDLEVDLTAGSLIPNQQGSIFLEAFNHGCADVSGQIKVVLLDWLISYNSADISPDEINGDTLIWNFSSLKYETNVFRNKLYFDVHQDALGHRACLTAIITPTAADVDVSNNQQDYCFRVVDTKNDHNKNNYPEGSCDENYVSESQEMRYGIQFENNTGSVVSEVVVLDSLGANLWVDAMSINSKSHPVYTEILPGNVLKFVFRNINLAPGESGYLTFEIDPIDNIVSGTRIENTAAIYLDGAYAGSTTTVHNTFKTVTDCNNTSTQEVSAQSTISLYPNPSSGTVNLKSDETVISVDITDINGRVVTSFPGNIKSFDVSELNAGLYSVIVTTSSSTAVEKLIKQ